MKKSKLHLAESEREYDSDAWCTPAGVIKGVRHTFDGGIDLDPCSNKAAQKIIKAKTFFTKEDDGLFQEWFGNVYINPPFSAYDPWVIKGLYHNFQPCTIDGMIYYADNATERPWFQTLLNYSHDLFIPSERWKCYHYERKITNSPMRGQALFLIATDNAQRKRFREYFVKGKQIKLRRNLC